MSREITYTANLSVTISDQTAYLHSLVSYANMTGTDFVRSAASLTSTIKLVDTGEVSTCGVSAFQNLSTTYTIELYTSLDGDKFMTLLPGETWVIRLGTSTPAAKTTSGSATLSYLICES